MILAEFAARGEPPVNGECDEPYDEAFFWATHQGAEIDLILRRGDRLLGIECKRSDAPGLTRSIRIALDDLGWSVWR